MKNDNFRIIPRLDIKSASLVKCINLEGLRKIGSPAEYAQKYYLSGADEILFIDIVASLYGRNQLEDIILATVENIYVPLTVVGGIRSLEDAKNIFSQGGDKIGINTAAISNPSILKQLSKSYGAQSIVLSIEAKKQGKEDWECYTDCGRERTYKNVVEWAEEAVELGVGEILVTSVDQEGTGKGFDYSLIKKLSTSVNVPVLASGGMGCLDDLNKLYNETDASGAAISGMLHYNKFSLENIKEYLFGKNIPVRMSSSYENLHT